MALNVAVVHYSATGNVHALARAMGEGAHGGNEATLLALYNTMYHWGSITVPTGYTDDAFRTAGANPYGTAHRSGDGRPGDAALSAAHAQGRRLVRVGSALSDLREAA